VSSAARTFRATSAAETEVAGAVNFAHAAGAQKGNDLVRAKLIAERYVP
jgi:hypothetical protein